MIASIGVQTGEQVEIKVFGLPFAVALLLGAYLTPHIRGRNGALRADAIVERYLKDTLAGANLIPIKGAVADILDIIDGAAAVRERKLGAVAIDGDAYRHLINVQLLTTVALYNEAATIIAFVLPPYLLLRIAAASDGEGQPWVHDIAAQRQCAIHIGLKLVELVDILEATVGNGVGFISHDIDKVYILVVAEHIGQQVHILHNQLLDIVIGLHLLASELFGVFPEQRLPIVFVGKVSVSEGSWLAGIESLDGNLELRSTVGPLVGVKDKPIVVGCVHA